MSRFRSHAVFQPAPPRSGGYWRSADAKAVLDRVEASGLSVRAFARREGLSVQRLYRWRRALGAGGAAKPAFIEVVGASSTAARLEIVFRSGVALRVPDRFDEQAVRSLVEILEGQPPRC